jgi:hypothetical protein
VLDDVERRRFLVQPARENPVEAPVALAHVDLNEGAGQFLLFPRGGRLACLEPHDHVLPARRLAGVESDVLDDAVALVEHAEHRDPVRHRRDVGLARGRCPRLFRSSLIRLLSPAVARRKREPDQQWCGKFSHAYSGIHGS